MRMGDEADLIKEFGPYFRVGVSGDFIMMRRDFPMKNISPGDFRKLIIGMFQENEEAIHGK
jgi:hypothetical protein